jgi:hypothetical protein
MQSSEMFLELRLLRYRAKGRNEQNIIGALLDYPINLIGMLAKSIFR